ncbi:hypothetical protein GQ457_02G030970 [Hibiscus cannabinus]
MTWYKGCFRRFIREKDFQNGWKIIHPRAENRDVKYWSKSNQYASGDSFPAGYVSRYIETTHVSVRQNDLEELKQIWEDLSRADRQAFVDRYGDIAYLLYVQVNEPMLRALIKFWNPGYRCFTFNSIDLMPTVEEYSELLRVPNIIEDRIYTKPKRNTNMPAQLAAFTGRSEEWASKLIFKKGENSCFSWFDIANITRTYLDPLKKADLIPIAIYGLVIFPRVLGYIDVALFDVFDQFRYGINPAPAILAETFISLNACRELEGGRFRGCAQFLYVWIRSHFWKTPKPVLPGIRSINFSPLREFLATEWEEVDPTKWVEAFRNLQEHDLVWRTPWLLTIEYLYRCYNYHWLMLLGLWGAIGCAPLLVSRQFGSRQFMPFTAGLRESWRSEKKGKQIIEQYQKTLETEKDNTTAWKRKSQDNKIRLTESQNAYNELEVQLNQSRAQHIQLEARVREQEDVIHAKELSLVNDLVIPPKFKVPEFEKFTGTTCPSAHLTMYCRKMSLYLDNEKLLIHCFQDSLVGPAARWYTQLSRAHIKIWRDLSKAFLEQYKHVSDMVPSRTILQTMEQKTNESFRQYAQRWRDVAAQVQPPLLENEITLLFVNTLRDDFYDRMLDHATKPFADMVMTGELIQAAIKSGIIKGGNDSRKYSRKRDNEVNTNSSYAPGHSTGIIVGQPKNMAALGALAQNSSKPEARSRGEWRERPTFTPIPI